MPEVAEKSQSKILPEKDTEIGVVIVAAGRGSRAQTDLPKQYCNLLGKTVLTRTIAALKEHLPRAEFVAVIHPDDQELFNAAVCSFSNISSTFGGATRQESVLNGLKALENKSPKCVLIHDAARPFVSVQLITNILTGLDGGAAGVIPAIPVTDTLKRVRDNVIEETVNRDGVYSVQTPQAFEFQTLIKAHQSVQHQGLTDDAAVFEVAGHKVQICTGDVNNFKITQYGDFKKAEAQIMNTCADVRVGSGYDVHQFKPGDGLWLCGVKIPYKKSLKGHSDADVGLHALTDAVLSAISEGDIGTHFPPSDEQWRGVDSSVFLKHAGSLVGQKDGLIAHVTVCLICENPKIGPHKDTMRTRIAEILGMDKERVSVQATTTEKLGFTGREEGIAAQATATIRLPLEI